MDVVACISVLRVTRVAGALAGGAIVVRAALLMISWQCKHNFNKVTACERVRASRDLHSRGFWLTCSAKRACVAFFGAGNKSVFRW